MTEFETKKRVLDTFKKQFNNLSFYPIDESGRLPPLLDDEDLLYKFYESANQRKYIKQFCKKNYWREKPNVPLAMNVAALKKLISSINPELKRIRVNKKPLLKYLFYFYLLTQRSYFFINLIQKVYQALYLLHNA